MKSKRDIEHPFTIEQWRALTEEQRQVINAVAEYLTGNRISDETIPNEGIAGSFDLLKPCHGCVPSEYADEHLLNAIRQKFGAVYQVGMELAEAELKKRATAGFNFCYLVDPSYEDATHIAILDYDRPVCYLHERMKAWHLGFETLADLASAVLQIKKCLVEKVAAYASTGILVVMEGGVVHEILNLPPNINVTVLDYDIDGVEGERLEISPIDGELCVINKW